MNILSDLSVSGQRVLVRVDFNVPLDGDTITDDTRIRGALPTIQALLDAGARPVLMSHLGRPKGEVKAEFSLRPVATRLSELLGSEVVFCEHTVGPEAESCIASAPSGAVVLLENTRFFPGETKNDSELASQLGELADVYVSDAFGTVHRAHASTAGVAAHVSSKAAGKLLETELTFLGKALDDPARPFVAILGGAKVSDKIGVIEALAPKVDRLLIGGAMAYTFLAAQGETTGTSLIEEDRVEDARALLTRFADTILIPTDHVIADAFAEDANSKTVSGAIPDGWMGLDIGPETRKAYEAEIQHAKTIIWNGPMGVFEMTPFAQGTLGVASALAEATSGGALTVVGGGDSVAAIQQAGLAKAVTHVSTGGGAMLEFMEGKVLPGVAALG